jgi:hypothetical protein
MTIQPPAFRPRPCLLAPALLALLAGLTLAAAAQGHGRDPHARVARINGWRTDLRAARQEAARDNKPLMVVLRCFD